MYNSDNSQSISCYIHLHFKSYVSVYKCVTQRCQVLKVILKLISRHLGLDLILFFIIQVLARTPLLFTVFRTFCDFCGSSTVGNQILSFVWMFENVIM